MKEIKILSVLMIFSFLINHQMKAQGIRYISKLMGTVNPKIELIESQDRIVESTIYDLLYKEGATTFEYSYSFSQYTTYHISAFLPIGKVYKTTITIYKWDRDSGDWKIAKEGYSQSNEFQLKFEPGISGDHKVVISCSLEAKENDTHFALIIDRER
jgi:hypothetical protein